MLHEFTLDKIHLMDGGRVAVAFDQAIGRALADCHDRPGVAKPRKVSMEVTLIPVCDDGFCDSVDVQFSFKDGMPARSSKAYNLGVRKRGADKQLQLVFNDLSLDNANQRTIDELAGDDDE